MSGVHSGPDHHAVAVELEAPLRDHLLDPAGALEALHLLAAVDLHAVLLEDALEEAAHLLAVEPLERHVLEHHERAALALGGDQRRRHLGRYVAAADQNHVLGLRGIRSDGVGVGEGAQVVEALEVAAVERGDGARSSRWRAAPCRTRSHPCSTASPRAPPRRVSSRSCGSSARSAARPTTRPGGRGRPRGSPCPVGSPSTAAAGCRAGRARGPRAGPSRPRPPRAASARSWPRPARRRSGDSRRSGRPLRRPRSGRRSAR